MRPSSRGWWRRSWASASARRVSTWARWPPVVGGGVDVALGVDPLVEQRGDAGVVEAASPAGDGGGQVDRDRTGADGDAARRGPAATAPSASQRDHRGDPGHRVVAVPAGQLDEGRAGCAAGSAGKNAGRDGELTDAQRGLHRSDEEAPRPAISRVPAALRDLQHRRRGRGARRASRPRGRRARGCRPSCPGCGWWGGRPGAAPAAAAGWPRRPRRRARRRRGGPARRPGRRRRRATSTASRPGSVVDVDEVAGCGQPHRQQRHQALATGEHLAVVPQLCQQAAEPRRDRSVGGR